MKQHIDLSIVYVNFNSFELTIQSIESVYKYTKNLNLEIIIVDNDSKDNSKTHILDKFNDIIWIDMGYNSGFARANNMGIRASSGRHILLLNTDTIICNEVLHYCVQALDQDTKTIAVGTRLIFPDGKAQISGAHFKKGGLNTLLPLPFIGKITKNLGKVLGVSPPSIDQISYDMEVDWLIGAFVMVRREALHKNVLLDEDFFMYCEEIEWCARLLKLGKIKLLAKYEVIHIGGGSSNEFYNTLDNQNGKNLWNKKGLQIMLSNFVRIRKQFGVYWLFIIFLFYTLESLFFFIFSTLNLLRNLTTKDSIQYFKNMLVCTKYIIRIIRNKPTFYKI